MRPVTETVVVHVPGDRLFTHLAGCWEAGPVLGAGDGRVPPAPTDRMRDGFAVLCPGDRWGLSRNAELVVTDFRPPVGWRAASAEPSVQWLTELSPGPGDRTRLTCRIDYRPRGPADRLRELIRGRRRRAGTLRRLLRRWRDEAERREALRRLRADPGRAPPDPHADADSEP